MNIAIVGCGWVAFHGHGPSLLSYAGENPQIRLAACCDNDQDKLSDFIEKFGFGEGFTSYRDMLDKIAPDAVFLAVPPSATKEIASVILSRRIPLFLEKPPGLSTAETCDLLEIVLKGKVPHQVAWNRRSMPLVLRLRDALQKIQEKEPLYRIEYEMNRVGRTESDFINMVAHGIDTIRFLTGMEYGRLSLHYQHCTSRDKPVINIYIEGEMYNGCRVSLVFLPGSGVVSEGIRAHAPGKSWHLTMPV